MSQRSRELLSFFESNPDAFTAGRRNDDVCNWFFARVATLRDNGETITLAKIINDFHILLESLTQTQQDDMETWQEDVYAKLEYCFRNYLQYSNDYLLDELWIHQW